MGQDIRVSTETAGTSHRLWAETIPNDGLIYYRGAWGDERVLLTSAKALQEVLVTKNYDFDKPRALRDVLSRIIGMGIIVAEGDEHRVSLQ